MKRTSIKKIFLPLFFMACTISAAAQRPQEQRQGSRRERTTRSVQSPTPFSEPLTNLEELDTKTGDIIIKNYTIVGAVSWGGSGLV